MAWRDWFQPKDFVTIALSAAALTLSIISWRTAVASGRHGAVSSQMQLYLGKYVETLDAEPQAFGQCGYARTTPRNRERARIVLGLLIGLVEAMDAADDRRARTWRGRLPELAGPLYDREWDPAVYAGSRRMAGEIAGLRRGRTGDVDCATPS